MKECDLKVGNVYISKYWTSAENFTSYMYIGKQLTTNFHIFLCLKPMTKTEEKTVNRLVVVSLLKKGFVVTKDVVTLSKNELSLLDCGNFIKSDEIYRFIAQQKLIGVTLNLPERLYIGVLKNRPKLQCVSPDDIKMGVPYIREELAYAIKDTHSFMWSDDIWWYMGYRNFRGKVGEFGWYRACGRSGHALTWDEIFHNRKPTTYVKNQMRDMIVFDGTYSFQGLG